MFKENHLQRFYFEKLPILALCCCECHIKVKMLGPIFVSVMIQVSVKEWLPCAEVHCIYWIKKKIDTFFLNYELRISQLRDQDLLILRKSITGIVNTYYISFSLDWAFCQNNPNDLTCPRSVDIL